MWNSGLEKVLLIIVITIEICMVLVQSLSSAECNHC
jgi:hypothetical protein